ncbi:peptidoglycan DD-metalloendopeptidase family protein [Elusimicrobiota bacterium]
MPAYIFASSSLYAPASLFTYEWRSRGVISQTSEYLTPEEFRKINRLIWAKHTVKEGDTTWSISHQYGTNVASIQSSNIAEMIWIRSGVNVAVLNKKGTLHKVRGNNAGEGQMLSEIIKYYARKCKKSRKQLTRSVISANNLPGIAIHTDLDLKPDTYILIPDVYLEFDTFRFPFRTNKNIVSSGFGRRLHPMLKIHRKHEGLDFPKPYGTKIFPSRTGRITFAGWKTGYGLLVVVEHTDDKTSYYGHLSRIDVRVGQAVVKNKTILGRVGSSGLATGPHLHFEIRDKNDRPVNPAKKFGRK